MFLLDYYLLDQVAVLDELSDSNVKIMYQRCMTRDLPLDD
jgi:hypothetical protein